MSGVRAQASYINDGFGWKKKKFLRDYFCLLCKSITVFASLAELQLRRMAQTDEDKFPGSRRIQLRTRALEISEICNTLNGN